jgi:hypothetical protein
MRYPPHYLTGFKNGLSVKKFGVVQKVPLLDNTGNVTFGHFSCDSTDSHRKKCYLILNHAGTQKNLATVSEVR